MYDKGIEKRIIIGESSRRKLNFDESPPLIIDNYQSNSQTNFNITSEPIGFHQTTSMDNIVVVAGKVLFY